MGLNIQTYNLPFNRGGFYYDPNYDVVPVQSMISGSRNINLHTGGREKRGGTAYVYNNFITGNPRITGLYQFSKRDGNVYLIIAANNGEIWNGNTSAIATGLTTGGLYSFETFNDQVYICNNVNQVKVWTGTGSASNLASPPSDWGTGSPIQLILHGRGASQRLWGIGVTGFKQNVYFSANNSDSFTAAGSGIIRIDSPDPHGLVGGIEFGDRLFVFSRNETYIIDDTSVNTSEWGYQQAQWTGGTASFRTLVKTPNDLFSMTEDGVIYSVATAQQYGDYKVADLTKASFIHEWIKDNVDLSAIRTSCHGIYDPSMNAIKWFVKRIGVTNIDTALVMYLDRDPAEAWTIHDNIDFNSGYTASVSCFGKFPGVPSYGVMTGDYSGGIWKLEQSTLNDNGNAYKSIFRTPPLPFDSPRVRKVYRRTHVTTKDEKNSNLTINIYVDKAFKEQIQASLAGTGSIYGVGIYGTAVYGESGAIIETSFDTRYIGYRIQYEIFNNNANEGFFVSRLSTDFKPLGLSPSMKNQ